MAATPPFAPRPGEPLDPRSSRPAGAPDPKARLNDRRSTSPPR